MILTTSQFNDTRADPHLDEEQRRQKLRPPTDYLSIRPYIVAYLGNNACLQAWTTIYYDLSLPQADTIRKQNIEIWSDQMLQVAQ